MKHNRPENHGVDGMKCRNRRLHVDNHHVHDMPLPGRSGLSVHVPK